MSNLSSLPPGFRFHPTDEELILHYLRNRAASRPCPVSIIAEVDIYKFDPWDLPARAMFGDKEWYFFSPRDRKYPNGIRPNRAAASGYWKATGTDKPIHTSKGNENIGVKKALVFYKGRPPKGLKTNWIMHEYRLAEALGNNVYKPMKFRDSSMRLDDWVLCRIYKKSNHMSSIPSLMDREQEESPAEDAYFSNLTSMAQQNPPRLQKTFSVSEFLDDYSALSHMFDNMPELPGPEQGALLGHPTSSQLVINGSNSGNGNHNLVQQLPQTGQFPAPLVENSAKRPRIAGGFSEEGKGKRNDSCSYANFSNQQLDSPQYNLLNPPFFSQQMLLNSQLKSQ